MYMQYLSLQARGEMLNLGDNVVTRANYRDYTVSFEHVKPVPGEHTFTVITNKLKEKSGGVLGEGIATATWTEENGAKANVDMAVAPEEACGTLSKESGEYDYGTLQIEATPTQGYELAYWTVNGHKVEAEENLLTHEVTGNASIRAYFTQKTCTVKLEDITNGRVEGAAEGVYRWGETVTFVAVPDEDCVVDKWMVNGKDYSESNEVLQLTLTEDVSVKVTFRGTNLSFCDYLTEGWYWTSHPLASAVEASFFAVDGVVRVLTQTQELYRDDVIGLTGQMDDIAPETGVKVFANGEAYLQFEGKMYDPRVSTVQLRKGWNWIGYPLLKDMRIDEALSRLKADEGDVITNLEDGYAEYVNGAWTGSLREMKPVRCYLYKSASDKQFRFNNERLCTESPKAVSAVDEIVAPWSVDVHAWPCLMCVTASLVKDNERELSRQYLVAAFVGDECRGIGQWIDGRIYLSVHGDEASGETVRFVALDVATGETYDVAESFVFTADVKGSASAPILLTVTQPTGIHGVTAERSGELYDLSGRRVTDIRTKGVYVSGKRKVVK